ALTHGARIARIDAYTFQETKLLVPFSRILSEDMMTNASKATKGGGGGGGDHPMVARLNIWPPLTYWKEIFPNMKNYPKDSPYQEEARFKLTLELTKDVGKLKGAKSGPKDKVAVEGEGAGNPSTSASTGTTSSFSSLPPTITEH